MIGRLVNNTRETISKKRLWLIWRSVPNLLDGRRRTSVGKAGVPADIQRSRPWLHVRSVTAWANLIPICYDTRRFIPFFTRARYWTLPWGGWEKAILLSSGDILSLYIQTASNIDLQKKIRHTDPTCRSSGISWAIERCSFNCWHYYKT
jgi:hypothetical protein